MGFLNWLKTEIDSTNINKRRYSKSSILNHTFSRDDVPDEAYTTALSKFNEWRQEKQFGTISKKNHKQLQKMFKKLERIKNKKCYDKNKIPLNESDLYEEIDKDKSIHSGTKDKHKKQKIKDKSAKKIFSSKTKHIDAIKKCVTNNMIIYESESNDIILNDNFSTNREFKNNSNQLNDIKSQIYEELKSKLSKPNDENSPLYQSIDGESFFETETVRCNLKAQSSSGQIQRDSILKPYVTEEIQLTNETCLFRNEIIPQKLKNIAQENSGIITDLDNCDIELGCYNNKTNIETESIMEELEILEKWSKSIENNICPTNKKSKNNFNENLTGIVIGSMSEVNVTPVNPIKLYGSHICSGTFRNAYISQQKKEDFQVSFQEQSILLNFDKLRKFRHPGITLLMGITIDDSKQINSLILESFKCSLSNEIHKTDNHITIGDALKYSIQLTRAVLYCHENKLIHSNICSETILISSYEKVIKLSSFELATTTDIVESIEDYDNDISLEVLPHLVSYRQNYSNHCYQSPELITTKLKYVFPSKESDVYGICLTLWEMLNKSIPFAFCNYKDLENLFHLQNTMLPLFEEERCKLFAVLLNNGLKLNPKNRIASAKILLNMLMQISKKNLFKDSSGQSFCSKNNYNQTENPNFFKAYENKSKNVISCSTPENIAEHKLTETKLNSNSKNIFETSDFHLPITPIARNNQLLKTAWLSETKMSPIEKIKESKEFSSNTTNLEQLYKVKIKIFSKDNSKEETSINNNTEVSCTQSSNISNKISYFNSISLPQIQEKNLVEMPEIVTKKQINIAKKNNMENKKNLSMPITELLNDSLCKQYQNSNTSFEDSQWKREKDICDNFNVSHYNNTSVKDTVKKFESFSTKCGVDNQHSKLDFFSSKDPTIENYETCLDKFNDNFAQKESLLNQTKNFNVTEESNVENDEIIMNSMEIEFKTLREYTPKYNSNLDIVLDNNNMNVLENDNESKLMKINVQKINRRNSDLSWYCQKIRVHEKLKTDYGRYSACSTDLLKRLDKFRQINVDKLNNNFSSETTEKKLQNNNKLHMGKFSCWNCGSKIFIINDNEKDVRRLSLPLSTTADQHISKSTEDIYIEDDDFCQLLGTNIELGTESELYNFF